MTTITKEWLQQTIAEFENTRDDIPFGLSDDDAKVLIVLKRALASLTAEPVRYLNKFSGTCVTLEQQPNAADDVAVYVPLYAAPPAQPASVVPEEKCDDDGNTTSEFDHGWNACRAALHHDLEKLNQPVSQAYELPEIIEGMEVSVDVSTCDFDAGHRYFGTVTEVSELDTAKNGYILLVQDAKPNFDVNGNSPVIPDGYALVPVEPTDEMIAAAMECDDVVFDSKDPTAFCVQFLEIYCAMVTAAPKPEVNSEYN